LNTGGTVAFIMLAACV